MGRVSFLAILAIFVTGALSNPNNEADPLPSSIDGGNYPIDCEWKDWEECTGTCGEGIQVFNNLYKYLNYFYGSVHKIGC